MAALRNTSGWIAPIIAVSAVTAWLTDSWTSAVTFRRFGTKVSFREMCLLRGATFLFDAINPVLGQMALGVAMYRRGAPLARTLQVMLLMNVVFVIQLVAVAGVGILLGQGEISELSTGVVLSTLLVAGLYLAVLLAKPRFLASRNAFAQLFDVGVGGHAFAFAARIPNMLSMFVSFVVTLRCFGIAVPAGPLLVYVPAIVVVSGTPISVQGLGPAQVAQVAFFARHVHADPLMAQATVLAWGLIYSLGHTLAWLVVGGVCFTTRSGRALFAAVKEEEALRRAEGSLT